MKGWPKGFDIGTWGDGNKDFGVWLNCRVDDVIIGKSFGATQTRQMTDINPNGSHAWVSYSAQRSGTRSGRMELEVINYHCGNQANCIEMPGGAVVGKVVFEGPYFETTMSIGWRGTGANANSMLVIDAPNMKQDSGADLTGQFRVQIPMLRNRGTLGTTLLKGGQITTNPGNIWFALEGARAVVSEKLRVTTDKPVAAFTSGSPKICAAYTRAVTATLGFLPTPLMQVRHDFQGDAYVDWDDPESAIAQRTVNASEGMFMQNHPVPFQAARIMASDTTAWPVAETYDRFNKWWTLSSSSFTNSAMKIGRKVWVFELGAAFLLDRRVKRGIVPGSLLWHQDENQWFVIRQVVDVSPFTVVADAVMNLFMDFTNDRYEWFEENTDDANLVSRGSGLTNNGLTQLNSSTVYVIPGNYFPLKRPVEITAAAGTTGTLTEGGVSTNHDTIAALYALLNAPVHLGIQDDRQEIANLYARDAVNGEITACTGTTMTWDVATGFTGTVVAHELCDGGAPSEAFCDGGFVDSALAWDKLASGASSPITNYRTGSTQWAGYVQLTNANASDKQGIAQDIEFDSTKNYTLFVQNDGTGGVELRNGTPTGAVIATVGTGAGSVTVAGASLAATVCLTPTDQTGELVTIRWASLQEQ